MANEVRVWIEQGAVHIKAVDVHGDPIELTVTEARALAQKLSDLADSVVRGNS